MSLPPDLAALERELEQVQQQLPRHSISPSIQARIDELEEQIDALKAQRDAAKSQVSHVPKVIVPDVAIRHKIG